MLGETETSNDQDAGKDSNSGNSEPPKVPETDTSKLMMEMGFTSLQSKIYSEANPDLEGENMFSYNPPTLAQAGF